MLAVVAAAGALALAPIVASPHARDLDLAQLVPLGGRLNAVWYTPTDVAVAWQYRDRRPVLGWNDTRRYTLTLWTRTHAHRGYATWVPHTLVRGSPFPMLGRAVRFADVTHDGRDDLLVTVLCSDCNHATAALSVFAGARRIYGHGFIGVAKGGPLNPGAHGDIVYETAWGTKHGDVWLDSDGLSATFRTQTFLRWTGRKWRVVSRRRVSQVHDRLLLTGYP